MSGANDRLRPEQVAALAPEALAAGVDGGPAGVRRGRRPRRAAGRADRPRRRPVAARAGQPRDRRAAAGGQGRGRQAVNAARAEVRQAYAARLAELEAERDARVLRRGDRSTSRCPGTAGRPAPGTR